MKINKNKIITLNVKCMRVFGLLKCSRMLGLLQGATCHKNTLKFLFP